MPSIGRYFRFLARFHGGVNQKMRRRTCGVPYGFMQHGCCVCPLPQAAQVAYFFGLWVAAPGPTIVASLKPPVTPTQPREPGIEGSSMHLGS